MYSVSSFSGPINGPASVIPSPSGSATHALICLHGFGSSGDDLIALAAPLRATLGNGGESLAVYSPHAPSPTPDGFGRQWFRDAGWTFRDESGLQRITPQLDDFIAQVAAAHGIPSTSIALLGFSQGAMTLLHALPSLTNKPAAVISCCGALTVPPVFPPVPRPVPILFVHGQDDDVLPADASVQAQTVYQQHNYPTQLHILPGLGHGIDGPSLAHISLFLQALWNTPDDQDA
ncbi:MAG: hypothetical protein EON60_02335 [Alphaproteobacteria bacterium]|nr:MAG: hypothetical protein EON60_02335 [Alphaproteobacteria bacterium]